MYIDIDMVLAIVSFWLGSWIWRYNSSCSVYNNVPLHQNFYIIKLLLGGNSSEESRRIHDYNNISYWIALRQSFISETIYIGQRGDSWRGNGGLQFVVGYELVVRVYEVHICCTHGWHKINATDEWITASRLGHKTSGNASHGALHK